MLGESPCIKISRTAAALGFFLFYFFRTKSKDLLVGTFYHCTYPKSWNIVYLFIRRNYDVYGYKDKSTPG